MTISIREAFRNAATERYNKENILYFSLIIAVLTIGSVLPTDGIKDKLMLFYVSAIVWLLSIVSSIFLSGYDAIACNNEANKRDNVIPALSEIKEILINGCKYFLGNIALTILAAIIPMIIFIIGTIMVIVGIKLLPLMAIGIITFIAGFIILILISYKYVFPLHLNYYKSLKLEDIFDLKQAIELRKQNKEYCSLFWKTILACILLVGVFLLFSICYYIVYKFTNFCSKEIADYILGYIYTVAISVAQVIYFPGLIKQFFNTQNNDDNEQTEIKEG